MTGFNLYKRFALPNWRPLLHIWVDIFILQIETSFYRNNINSDAVEYCCLGITFFHKWGFRIRLYDTGLRMYSRGDK
jgi:hypothetical protein